MNERHDEARAIVALNLLDEIGPRRFNHLRAAFGSASAALAAPEPELARVEGISRRLAARIARLRDGAEADEERELARSLGVTILTCADGGYPAALSVIPDAPPVVYVRGALRPDDSYGVAVVGTRRPTHYGRSVAARLGADFARRGITTVSGLARGIDTEVHRATLSEGGRTIAVLGNGLNRHYPPENRKLEEAIERQGALVSEFPMNMSPDTGHFPRRNRLIAGLALATVVVEADIKSGALITARFAADQGKDVFAVPGPVFSRTSAGPHYLLRSGARLAESAADVTAELAPLAEWLRAKETKSPERAPEAEPDADEQQVVRLLEQHLEGLSIDELSRALPFGAGKLSAVLLALEMKGFVRSLPGKMYARNY